MICPRCEDKEARLFIKSPVGDVWELYLCGNCGFMWRSSEEKEVRDPEKYNPVFKISVSIDEYKKKRVQIPPLS